MSTADSRVQAILEAGDDPFMLLVRRNAESACLRN